MAVRRVRVKPDHEVLIGDQIVPVVSRDAIARAIMDGESMLHMSGGILTIMVGRHKTDLDGEAVTTGAIVEWKDGVRAKPIPEVEVDVLPAPEPEAAEEPEPVTAS